MKIITGGVYVAVFNSERSDQSPVPMTSHKLYSHLKTPTTRIISGRVHVAVYSGTKIGLSTRIHACKLAQHEYCPIDALVLLLLVAPVLVWI